MRASRLSASAPAVPSRYESLGKLAAGGMATVYLGRLRGAVGFSRLVALKVPHEHLMDDLEARRLLRREATVCARVRHVNVVAVLDVEQVDDRLIMVLDYVDGGPLSRLCRPYGETSVSAAVATKIILDVAEGLHAAHAATDDDGTPLGIVHRDVTPHNILVGCDGIARIADFGIAHTTRAEQMTSTGVLRGKLGYMAPEYIAGARPDARSDQYCLAVIAWEVLGGERLFRRETDHQTLSANLDARLPTGLPSEASAVEPVLARALSRTPEDRFPSMRAFGEALRGAATSIGLSRAEDVAAAVERAFGCELSERRARARQQIADVTGGFSEQMTLPEVSPEAVAKGAPSEATSTRAVLERQRPLVRQTSRFPLLVILGAAVIAALVTATATRLTMKAPALSTVEASAISTGTMASSEPETSPPAQLPAPVSTSANDRPSTSNIRHGTQRPSRRPASGRSTIPVPAPSAVVAPDVSRMPPNPYRDP